MSSKQTGLTGKQTPRVQVEPDRAYTDGGDAAMLAADCGLKPDPWQETILDAWLGRDEFDQFTAATCGLSVPRQNGKNAVIEMRELYGLCVLGETILHTAHEVKTAAKSFRRLCGFFEDDRHHPELSEMVKVIRRTNGQERIELINGGLIEFSARSKGAARGFSTQMVVFDEAGFLRDEELEAILPTLAASSSGHRQIIMTGTPPSPEIFGTVFARTRQNALKNTDDSLAWHEWSVEEVGDVQDRSRWYETNPALGFRLSEEYTETECNGMSEEGFARERLGWWQEGGGRAAISSKTWHDLETDNPPMEGKISYGVKFNPDDTTCALAACIKPKEGYPHVELVDVWDAKYEISELANWLIERREKAAMIVIDGRSGADTLAAKLIEGKVSRKGVKVCSPRDVIAATTRFSSAVKEKEITHYGQESLDEAALNAVRRPIGRDGGYGWGSNGVDVTPLEAVTLAYFGAVTTKRDPSRKVRIL